MLACVLIFFFVLVFVTGEWSRDNFAMGDQRSGNEKFMKFCDKIVATKIGA